MPLTVFKFTASNLSSFQAQLADVIKKAPNYFVHAPVLLDVQSISDHSSLDFATICSAFKAQKIIPIGIKGLAKELHEKAIQFGLAIVKAPQRKKDTAATSDKSMRKTKLITTPVRSGAQIYAPDGDLVIMSGVNAGAEVIADGHIHIYGPLRGRALAGAQGDESARIFCQSLEAELISVAGCYLVKDSFQFSDHQGSMIQIYLEDQHINIEGI